MIQVTDPESRTTEFEYDAPGRRTDVAFLGGSELSFDFDWADRPLTRTHEFANATVTVANSFDDAGLLESQDISDARFYPLLGVEEGAFTPNALNQYLDVNDVVFSYDLNGNLTSDGVATYAYDALNRLTSAAATQNATYLYDALDRRVAKVVDGQATWYLYDGARALGEYDGAGNELRRFVYGAWIDEPVCMANATARYFYHHDRLGTVAALADASGELAEAYRYTPFGNVAMASALGNPYHFTGRRLDPETGLYYYRARMYDPTLGRFLQPDPIGGGGGVNLYRYVGNGYVLYVDPYGLCTIIAGQGVSLTAGMGIEISAGGWIHFGGRPMISTGDFVSIGSSWGLNVSTDYFGGFILGDIGNLWGVTHNINITIEIISITLIYNQNGDFNGMTFGVGPGATPIGGSGSISNTFGSSSKSGKSMRSSDSTSSNREENSEIPRWALDYTPGSREDEPGVSSWSLDLIHEGRE